MNKYSYFQHPNVDILKDKDFLTNDLLTYHGGGLISEVEERFSKEFDIKYTLSTASGTTAIYTMFKTIGLQKDDEVLVQSYTFFATATPLNLIGCKPVLVDTLNNGNIDPIDLEKKITSKTKAVIVTHLWGIPCDMDKITEIAKKYNLSLLEDCSHAHGTKYNGQNVGSFGSCSAWSVGAKKNISGGVGGMFCTNDLEIYKEAILLNHFNRKDKKDLFIGAKQENYFTTGTGSNLRLHPFSAYMINEQLKVYKKTFEEKKEVAEFVINELTKIDGIDLPYIPENAQQSYYALTFLFDEEKIGMSRDTFINLVNEKGAVELDAPNSTCPLNKYYMFQNKDISDFEKELPNAYKYHNKVFKMPVWYGEDRFEYAKFYIDIIKSVLL